MSVYVIELITACCVVAGGLFTLARWIGKVDQNTVATENLTKVFEKHSDSTNTTLKDHEHRITILESK